MSDKNKQILYLTINPETGYVWFILNDGPPTCEDMDVPTFIQSIESVLAQYSKIRIVGLRDNALLFVALSNLQLNGALDLNVIELCTPLCCETTAQREDPSELLYAMRNIETLHPIHGGWHVATEFDRATYSLTKKIIVAGKVTDEIETVFKTYHPLWKALSFIPSSCPKSCAMLVSILLDPRWYSDPDKPDSLSKLEAYLGLDNGRHPERQLLVLDAWFGNARKKTEEPDPSAWTESELDSPNHFLLRTALSVSSDRGYAKASKHFVQFLHTIWLSELYPNRAEPIFDPSLFFARKSEAAAFKRHTKELS